MNKLNEINFLFEQDGEPERELKEEFKVYFKYVSAIKNAYLARISYGSQPLGLVALCIAASHCNEKDIVNQISKIFQRLFGSHEHLDIIFLNHEQEIKISRVCNAFYNNCKLPN